MSLPKVSVIMPTYGRPTVYKAINSVLSQSIENIELIVIVDPWRFHGEFISLSRDPRVQIVMPERGECPKYLPSRVALLRNYGIQMAKGDYIAHLDDDNWWSSQHLTKLCDLLDLHKEFGFAHSWRILVDKEGKPFPIHTYPWSTRYKNNEQIFERFVEYGLAEPGEPYIKDCVISENGDEIFHVDTSEFCVRRTVHDQIPFTVEFSLYEIIQGHSDDDTFCKSLYRQKIQYGCSQEYSLFYCIGGFSNLDDEELLKENKKCQI